MKKNSAEKHNKSKPDDTNMIAFVRRIAYLLNRREKWGAIVLLCIMLLSAVFEMVGVGAIPAYLALLSDPEVLNSYPWMQEVVKDLEINTREQLALAGALVLIAVFLSKNGLLVVLKFVQTRYTTGRRANISSRLFRAYVNSPYPFHLQRNSSVSIRNVTNDVYQVVQNGISPLLNLLKELSMITGIIILLLAVEPLITFFVVAAIGGTGGAFYAYVRRKISKRAEIIQALSGEMYKIVIEGLRGIKDVKVLGREEYFDHRFHHTMRSIARSQRYNEFVAGLPALFLETTGVVVMLSVAAILVQEGRPVSTLVPTLALFGVAAFRLMPNFSRVLQALTAIRTSFVSAEVVYQDLRRLERGQNSALVASTSSFPKLTTNIQIDELTFHYDGAESPVLSDICLTIPCGSAVAFVGATGSGKTTIVDNIMGLLSPQSGRILVDGVDISSDLRSWQDQIGYIPQSIFLTDDSIRRNVAFGITDDLIDEDRVWKALDSAQLKSFVENLPEGLDTFVGEQGVRISGGQLQRVGIARALYVNPQVLIMDEATSALDSETEQRIVESINRLREKHTVIMIAHRLTTVRDCDLLFFLKDGRVEAAGTYEELLKQHKEFSNMAQGVSLRT